MRTDCRINPEAVIRCPNIPLITQGRPAEVLRGDWIEWRIYGVTYRGRVIGSVNADDLHSEFICVTLELLGGETTERWVHPEWVVDTAYSYNRPNRAAWLYGEGFFESVDKARQSYEKHFDELRIRPT